MKNTLFAGTLAALLGAGLTPSANAANADKPACEAYAKASAVQNGDNLRSGCGFSGPEWNSNAMDHLKWCLQGRSSQELSAQRADRMKALRTCMKAHKAKSPSASPAKAPSQAKGAPNKRACQQLMANYTRYMNAWNSDQAQCQKLAQANKPTSAVYQRYLTACNNQDKTGRNFFRMGCDKAYPDLPQPGQGPNTCAKQVQDNCPKIAAKNK